MSAIAHYYKLKNLGNPADFYAVKRLIAKYKSKSPALERLPINSTILSGLLRMTRAGAKNLFYKAALYVTYFLMYHLALRISEVCNYTGNTYHAIRREDLKIHETTGKVEITLYSYKHSKKPVIYEVNRNETFLHYLKTYLKLRKQKQGTLMIHESGANISRNFVANQLKEDIKKLGLDPNKYNTHSFRAGRATDMAREGKSDRQIAAIGRWNSNAFHAYIKQEKISI